MFNFLMSSPVADMRKSPKASNGLKTGISSCWIKVELRNSLISRPAGVHAGFLLQRHLEPIKRAAIDL